MIYTLKHNSGREKKGTERGKREKVKRKMEEGRMEGKDEEEVEKEEEFVKIVNLGREERIKCHANCPRVTGSIEGREVVGLCDTGAEVSVISTSVYKNYLESLGVRLQPTRVVLQAVGHGTVSCRGRIIVKLEICGVTVRNVAFLVCDEVGESYSVLWGMNVLAEVAEIWPVMYNLSKTGVTQKEWGNYMAGVRQITSLNKDDNWGYIITRSSKLPVIPGNTMRLIPIYVKQLRKMRKMEVLLEPLTGEDEGWIPEGIILLPTTIETSYGQGLALIANMSENEVKLRRKWRVGRAAKAEEVKKVREEEGVTKASIAGVELYRKRKSMEVKLNEELLNEEQVEEVRELLAKYEDVFAEEGGKIGKASGVKHRIPVTTTQAVRVPYRRIPPHQVAEVKGHIGELLEQGVITQSVSPYSAAIVVVRKKDGTLRLCIDYRQLNKVTIRDAFPIPRIEETVEALAGAKIFSTLDLAAGYHQIEVEGGDQHKTAFSTPFGHFEWKRLPMGLSNSPSTFQRFMERILGDRIFNTLLVYLDDIIVFSKTVEEHMGRLEELFARMREYGMKFKPKKCQLFEEEVIFLGFKVTRDGIMTDPGKIEAVKVWPKPKTVRDVRAFIGFCSFYRKFIKHFAHIAAPLHQLMGGDSRKNIEKDWDEYCQLAFEELKLKMVTAPVLQCPDFTQEFILETDASLKGLGAVLLQNHEGKNHPVSYASRGLRKSERNMANYSSRKLELLALKWAVCHKFRDYLVGKEFVVYTDNSPLSHLETSKFGAIESQWVNELQQFEFKILYKPGQDNTVADELSRLPGEIESESEEEYKIMAVNIEEDEILWSREDLRREQELTKGMKEIRAWVEKQTTMEEIKEWLKEEEFRKLYRVRKRVVVEDGILWHKKNVGINTWKIRPILPKRLQFALLRTCHDEWGHQGRNRVTELVNRRGYWPDMSETIEEYVKNCERCCVAKKEFPKPQTLMGKLEASRPWEMIAVDFTILEKRMGIENILVVTDIFTRYSFAIPTRDQKATTVADVLKTQIFDKFGAPDKLLSDQGRNFLSQLISQLCKCYGVKKVRTTAYHPQGNGVCERFNRTLHGLLITLEEYEKKKWPDYISQLVAFYNMSVHDTTGFSPFELLFGREPRLPVDPNQLEEEEGSLEEWVEEWKERQKVIWQVAKKNEKKRKTVTRKARESKGERMDWEAGREVFLRNNAKIGRCKIQDEWGKERWKVIEVLDNEVGLFRIRNELMDQERIENRTNLRLAPEINTIGGVDKGLNPVVVSPRRLRNRDIKN